MHKHVITAFRQMISRLDSRRDHLIIDADAHITDILRLEASRRERRHFAAEYYHGRPISAEDLVCEMDAVGIDMALIWQDPAATVYSDDAQGNTDALLAANRYIRDAARSHPARFIPAGWTDPKACGAANAIHIVETCVREFGFAIVKMNPAQNRYPIDSPEVMTVVDRIVALGAVPAFHFGADTPFTPAEGLARVAGRHADHPLLAVHMGGGGASYSRAEELYHAARRLGLERPNIRYVLSAKRDTHIEDDLIAYQLAGEPFCRNLFCGSDAPYGRMSWNFGGFRAMFRTLVEGACHGDARMRNHPGLFTPEVAQNYMGGNFARFAAAACRSVLEVETRAARECR